MREGPYRQPALAASEPAPVLARQAVTLFRIACAAA